VVGVDTNENIGREKERESKYKGKKVYYIL
jgi:hypothetical protein